MTDTLTYNVHYMFVRLLADVPALGAAGDCVEVDEATARGLIRNLDATIDINCTCAESKATTFADVKKAKQTSGAD